MKRNILMIGLLLVGMISLVQSTFGADGFSNDNFYPQDVAPKDWYYDAVFFAEGHSYMSEDINQNFRPSNFVTRAEGAKMLQKFAWNVNYQQGSKNFTDPWYEFKLTFPDSWRGYLFETYYFDPYPAGQTYPLANTLYSFELLNNKNEAEQLFIVQVWEKKAWEKYVTLATQDGYKTYRVLGQNSEYVVTTDHPDYDPSTELLDEKNKMSQILDSFVMF